MNRTELIKLHAEQELTYVPFWGGFMSQWYPSVFTVDGQRYATAEHYMMAAKAKLFHNDDLLSEILSNDSPSDVKKMGRKVQNFDFVAWDAIRFQVVVDGSVAKFGSDPVLLEELRATGDSILVEASPYDKIWGIGMLEDDPRVHDPGQWDGENLLGFALMKARDILCRIS